MTWVLGVYKAIIDVNERIEPNKQFRVDDSFRPRQQALSHLIDERTLKVIRSSKLNDNHFQAHLNHTTANGAGSWLHATPSRDLGTKVDDHLYRTMVQ